MLSQYFFFIFKFCQYINLIIKKSKSCSSADEGEQVDGNGKAIREIERRQANNVRERYVMSTQLLNLM